MARIVPGVRGMYIALTLHLLWTLGAALVITRRQRIPASAAAWLALVFLLPVAGTLLYVLAGYRRAVPAAASCDCRGDAVAEIVNASRYVSQFGGGQGSVRDVLEQVMRARGDRYKEGHAQIRVASR